jgi:hypothetical protein
MQGWFLRFQRTSKACFCKDDETGKTGTKSRGFVSLDSLQNDHEPQASNLLNPTISKPNYLLI